MFSSADTARNTSGTDELPTALRRHEKKLYSDVAMSPAKITSRYSFMPVHT